MIPFLHKCTAKLHPLILNSPSHQRGQLHTWIHRFRFCALLPRYSDKCYSSFKGEEKHPKRVICNYHHSMKNITRLNCCHLYCYECAARVTMPTATNKWCYSAIAWYKSDNDITLWTFDFDHRTFRHNACDLQYLIWILAWLVVLTQILAWLAVKKYGFL